MATWLQVVRGAPPDRGCRSSPTAGPPRLRGSDAAAAERAIRWRDEGALGAPLGEGAARARANGRGAAVARARPRSRWPRRRPEDRRAGTARAGPEATARRGRRLR